MNKVIHQVGVGLLIAGLMGIVGWDIQQHTQFRHHLQKEQQTQKEIADVQILQAKVAEYESHLSEGMAEDYMQIAGNITMTAGTLQAVIQNQTMEPEAQESLINSLQELSFQLETYERLAYKTGNFTSGEEHVLSSTVIRMLPMVASISPDNPLTSEQQQQLASVKETLASWNDNLSKQFPDLKEPDTEAFNDFYNKHKEQMLANDKWAKALQDMGVPAHTFIKQYGVLGE